MNKIGQFVLVFLFLLAPFKLLRAQESVSKLVTVLQQAINQRDTSLITPFLAPHFSIYTSTWPGSARMLQYILEKSDNDCSIQYSGVKPQKLDNGRTMVSLQFSFKQGAEVKTSGMVLDREGRIEYLDYFDQLYGMFREKPSGLVAEIPFEYEEGEIMVKLRLNDNPRELKFMFDTGADGMAITNTLADSIGIRVSRSQSTSVVGGNVNVQISSGNTVHLGPLSIPNKNMAIFPKEHSRVDGILGLSLANNFIIEVDFDASLLRLYSFGKLVYPKKGKVIPVTNPSGVAMLDGALNISGKKEVKGHFIFDTGAKFSLVCFENFVRRNRLLVSGFKHDDIGSMGSFGTNTTIYTGKSKSFSIGEDQIREEMMPVTLQASNGKNDWNPDADGSLGIRFSEHYNFTINLVDKVICFVPRKLEGK